MNKEATECCLQFAVFKWNECHICKHYFSILKRNCCQLVSNSARNHCSDHHIAVSLPIGRPLYKFPTTKTPKQLTLKRLQKEIVVGLRQLMLHVTIATGFGALCAVPVPPLRRHLETKTKFRNNQTNGSSQYTNNNRSKETNARYQLVTTRNTG